MGKRIIIITLLGVVAALLIRALVIEGIYVASGSMEPTFTVGTPLFLEKIVYKFRSPRRGEIVVFKSPVEEKIDLIKRVIAIPGDRIEIKKKKVILNGSMIAEDYVKHTRPDELLTGDNIAPLIVPQGMVFIMGDNRDESKDSRDWKDPLTGESINFIFISNIKGKVI